MNDESGDGDAVGGRERDGGRDAVERLVLAVTAAALLARLVSLGDRSFHWDEARLGYWTLRYVETGLWTYRPVAGGPFLYHLLEPVFSVVPASDALARLPVALVGGALPSAALVVRDRLDDAETVALALLLGFSPTLLYYSRFLRGDVPLAAFGLFAVAFAVRYRDRGARRDLYAATAMFALSLSASGFVVASLASWLVAAVLVFDHRRILAADRASTLARVDDALDWVREESTTLARSALLGLAVLLYAFAPRGGPPDSPSLFRPSTIPGVVEAAFVTSVERFVAVWVDARQGHSLLGGLTDYVDLLEATALPVVGLAVAGFLLVRYVDGPAERPFVMFAAYWGGAGLFVVPVIAELIAPWTAVHVVVPLSVPAAVAGGSFARFAARALRTGDSARVAVAALLVLSLAIPTGSLLANEVYDSPEPGDSLVQYGQPSSDLDGFYVSVRESVAGNEGTDVLYLGARFYIGLKQSADRPPVPAEFGGRLPLPWYLERLGAQTDSAFDMSQFPQNPPPVVVAEPHYRDRLEARLPAYRVVEYRTALWNRRVVVFYDTSAN